MNKRIKFLVLMLSLISFTFGFLACQIDPDIDKDKTEWTNENSVYATVYLNTSETNIETFVNNIEEEFSQLNFKKLYITQAFKQDPWVSITTAELQLLFILNESGEAKVQEFMLLLQSDERISGVQKCYDFPFETIDTRYLEATKYPLKVGEIATISPHGYLHAWNKPFFSNVIEVELVNFDKNRTYKDSDFPKIRGLSVLSQSEYGIVYLDFKDSNYFDMIKAINTLSRSNKIANVQKERLFYEPCPPPIWQISDMDIIDFTGSDDWGRWTDPVTILGKKAGKAIIDNNGVSLEIAVFDKLVESDLIDKYSLTVSAFVWNDYMPYVQVCSFCSDNGNGYGDLNSELVCDECGRQNMPFKRYTYCTVKVNSTADPMPVSDIDVYATIVSGSQNISIAFANIPGAGLRPTTQFFIAGEYDIFITIIINNEFQVVHYNQVVETTH